MRISDWSSDVCSSDLETAEQWIRQSHGLPTRQLLRASDGVPCAEGEKATNIGWYAVCDTARGRFGARKEVTHEFVVALTGMPEQEVAGSIRRRPVFAVGKNGRAWGRERMCEYG